MHPGTPVTPLHLSISFALEVLAARITVNGIRKQMVGIRFLIQAYIHTQINFSAQSKQSSKSSRRSAWPAPEIKPHTDLLHRHVLVLNTKGHPRPDFEGSVHSAAICMFITQQMKCVCVCMCVCVCSCQSLRSLSTVAHDSSSSDGNSENEGREKIGQVSLRDGARQDNGFPVSSTDRAGGKERRERKFERGVLEGDAI